MNTTDIIKLISQTDRKLLTITTKHALAYLLYKINTPVSQIAQILHTTKRNTYYAIYHTRDLLEAKDITTTNTLQELKQHSLNIKATILPSSKIKINLYIDNLICQ